MANTHGFPVPQLSDEDAEIDVSYQIHNIVFFGREEETQHLAPCQHSRVVQLDCGEQTLNLVSTSVF